VHFQTGVTKNLDTDIQQTEQKLDRLVNAFLDGVIEEKTYLAKKDEFIRTKTALVEKKAGFARNGNFWIEPLRGWLQAAHKAEKLAVSNDWPEIKTLVEEIGTNLILRDKKVLWDWKGPWEILRRCLRTADFRASQGIYQDLRARREWGRGVLPQGRNTERTEWWRLLNDVRTYFENETQKS